MPVIDNRFPVISIAGPFVTLDLSASLRTGEAGALRNQAALVARTVKINVSGKSTQIAAP